MLCRSGLVSLLLLAPLACGGETSDTDTSSETSDSDTSAGPETDQEKTMRLAQERIDAINAAADAHCQCEVQGGVATYETCLAEYNQADLECEMEVQLEHAGPEMIAYLECFTSRSLGYIPCYTEADCAAMGASGQEFNQCIADNNIAHACESLYTDAYYDEVVQRCP